MTRLARATALAVVVLLAGIAGPVSVAATPPQPPASYYGQVTVDGEPAPAGVTVAAVVDGTVVATLETDADGTFGGPGAFDEKLEVSKPVDPSNATVTFRVGGEPTGVTVNWSSGSVRELSLSVRDNTEPTASIQAVDTANVGNIVRFDAVASDAFGVASVSWSFGDGATATGASVTHAYDAPGQYTVALTVTDTTGNEVRTTTTVAVQANAQSGPSTPERTPANEQDPSQSETPPGNETVPVTLTLTENQTVISTSSVASNQTATVSFPATNATATASTTLTGMNVSVTESASLNLSVSMSDAVPASVPEPDSGDGGGEVVTYIRVVHDVPEETVGSVSFQFTVKTATLQERGVTPGNVVLYRFHDGTWNALETRHVGTTDGTARFVAESPGLSVFAVRTAQPSVNVTDASLNATSVGADESVTLTVTVRNDGGAAGNRTVAVTLDGERVASRTVTVAANASETVTFTLSPTPGAYDVAVNGVSAGTLTVTEASTTTSPPTSTRGGGTTAGTTTATVRPPAEGSQLDLMAFFAFGVVAVLVVVVLAVARRRQQ